MCLWKSTRYQIEQRGFIRKTRWREGIGVQGAGVPAVVSHEPYSLNVTGPPTSSSSPAYTTVIAITTETNNASAIPGESTPVLRPQSVYKYTRKTRCSQSYLHSTVQRVTHARLAERQRYRRSEVRMVGLNNSTSWG